MSQRPYLPTPAQIARVCREIQAEWSPEVEEQRRVTGPPKAWTPHSVRREKSEDADD